MPVETLSWLFPGLLFILTVLFSTVWFFARQEIQDLKNSDTSNLDRFLKIESKLEKGLSEMRDEAKHLVEKSQARADRDIELLRADMREQMAQMREALRSTETNILNQLNLLFRANNIGNNS
jgi:ElaB/YqjD/DUF883 family membrane-anchored ribosome-binding protein